MRARALTALLAALLAAGCRSAAPLTEERLRSESVVRQSDTQRRADTLLVHDSIYICRDADTVFVTRWHTRLQQSVRVDSFFCTDTLWREAAATRQVQAKSPLSGWLPLAALLLFAAGAAAGRPLARVIKFVLKTI